VRKEDERIDYEEIENLAKVAERGMFRPSLVHPQPIRRLHYIGRTARAEARLTVVGRTCGLVENLAHGTGCSGGCHAEA